MRRKISGNQEKNKMSQRLPFAVIGTGFWSNFQIAAWMEVGGVDLVAVCDRVKEKAEAIAQKFTVPRVYNDVQEMLDHENLAFVDIITDVDTHARFTELAARKGISVICQKPMAPKLQVAEQLVRLCKELNVPFFVHENWRWQSPIRKVKEIIETGEIGRLFKSHITFCSAFPVFDNQPFLAELNEFILTDIGSHILDVCRFLFGEVRSLLCHTLTINSKIKGEDVANVFMKMENGMSCYAEMSYASILEYEAFPETFILIEGADGSIHLGRNCEIKVTTRSGTRVIHAEPKTYEWADPKYSLIHSSIVECCRDLLKELSGKGSAETTSRDNLETVRLVHACYASARTNKLIDLKISNAHTLS
jgi:predicted dehydrogenase